MVSKKLFFYLLLAAGTTFAQSRWIRVRSENFEMYSDASEASTRETLRSLEQIRSFLLASTGSSLSRPDPTYIIGFKSEAEFAPYRLNEAAGAFYLTGADRDLVVVGGLNPEGLQAAARAYAQLAVRQSGLSLPAWLDQGLADLCSTLKQTGTVAATLGEMTVDQRRSLAADPAVPVATIVGGPTVTSKSRLEGETLVHMLVLSPDYGSKFKELVAALQNGATSQAALEKVYAKPLAGIEKDLQSYTSGGHVTATSIPLKSSMIQQPEQAHSYDLNLALAAIYNRPGQDKEAQERLESFSRANPSRPEPWAGLGYVALRRGESDLAAQDFERALAAGARSPELMWDHARLGWRDSAGNTEEWLNQLLQQEPNRVDARVKLAAIYLDRRKPRQAYDLLQPVKEIPAGDAPRFLAELAYAEVEMGERTQAQATLARLEKSTPSSRDTAELNRLKGYLTGAVAALTPEKAPEKAPVVTRVTLGSSSSVSSAGAEERQKAAETLEKAAAAARERAVAEARALEAAESLERQAAEAREKVAALARERVAAEAQEKSAAKAREKADAEANAKDAAEAREKAAAEAREKTAAEAREKADAKLRAKAEAEAQAKAAAEAKEKAIAEAREKAAAEAREKAEALARAKAEAEAAAQARAKAAADAREKALAEARAKAAASVASVAPQPAPTLLPSNIVPPSVASKINSDDDLSTGSLPAAPAVPKADDSSIATGVFVEMVCLDTQIKIVLQTPEGKKNFLIADPSNVVVSGREGGRVELDCGPQKPVNVRVLFGVPNGAPFDGLVKGLYFE